MRCRVYFTLLLTYQFIFGMMGAYSVAKKGMTEDIGITEDVFGIGQLLGMISRILMTTYLTLFPPTALLRTYLEFSLVQLLGYAIIALGHYLPSAATPLFCLGQFVFGVGRSIFSFPYLILIRTFSRPQDAFILLLWVTLSLFGNSWGIWLETLMEDTLEWPWHAALTVFSLVSLLTVIIAFVAVPEQHLPEEQVGLCEYATSMATIIRAHFSRKTSNVLNWLNYIFLGNQVFILLFWPAYYFNQLGYGYASSVIVSAFPVCILLGTLVFQPLFQKFPTYSGIIGSILIALNCLSFAGMFFLGNDESDIPIYMVLLGFGCFVWIIPLMRSWSTEVIARTENPRETYLVTNFMVSTREVLTGITLFVIGLSMEQNIRGFLWVLLANIVLALLFQVLKAIYTARERAATEELSDDSD